MPPLLGFPETGDISCDLETTPQVLTMGCNGLPSTRSYRLVSPKLLWRSLPETHFLKQGLTV